MICTCSMANITSSVIAATLALTQSLKLSHVRKHFTPHGSLIKWCIFNARQYIPRIFYVHQIALYSRLYSVNTSCVHCTLLYIYIRLYPIYFRVCPMCIILYPVYIELYLFWHQVRTKEVRELVATGHQLLSDMFCNTSSRTVWYLFN